jgi:hypothetical protein
LAIVRIELKSQHKNKNQSIGGPWKSYYLNTILMNFRSFSDQTGFAYQRIENKWFNGLYYSPVDIYQLRFGFNNAEIDIKYEVRRTNVDSPSTPLGSMGDRHFCAISCHLRGHYGNFEITARTLIQKILRRKPALYFKVKTNDSVLKRKLLSNQNLNHLFYLSENTPEFSPSIRGENGTEAEKNYVLFVLYGGSKKMRVEILHNCIEFCKNFSCPGKADEQ